MTFPWIACVIWKRSTLRKRRVGRLPLNREPRPLLLGYSRSLTHPPTTRYFDIIVNSPQNLAVLYRLSTEHDGGKERGLVGFISVLRIQGMSRLLLKLDVNYLGGLICRERWQDLWARAQPNVCLFVCRLAEFPAFLLLLYRGTGKAERKLHLKRGKKRACFRICNLFGQSWMYNGLLPCHKPLRLPGIWITNKITSGI